MVASSLGMAMKSRKPNPKAKRGLAASNLLIHFGGWLRLRRAKTITISANSTANSTQSIR
jgi:hypothetical protein